MKKVMCVLVGSLLFIGCAKDLNQPAATSQPVAQHGQDDKSNLIFTSTSEPSSDTIKFEEKSTLGRGGYIEVKQLVKVGPNHSQYERLKGKSFYITIGRIHKGGDGMFRYYEPETNELNPTLIDKDMNVLKQKVVSKRTGIYN
ncbi:MAG: hypothetical protein OEV87_09740 [Phycisphaerae bacterium]|nr:hypothetical protein [Phycisphaerae bacterium]